MTKIITGFIIASLAILTPIANKLVNPGDVYGNTLSGIYVKISSSYTVSLCIPLSTNPCAYAELPAGEGIVTESFSRQQGEVWTILGYLQPLGTGIFVGL